MTTVVLIPGAGGSGWYWHLVVPELERRGLDAVPVDLPAADDEAGLASYSEAVVRAASGRGELVLVAQSMGGLTAPLVCRQLPVRLLVLVNAMVPRPGETGGQWWEATGQAEAMRSNAARLGLEPADLEDPRVVYGHDMDENVFVEAGARMGEQSARPFADPWPLEAWPDIPTVVLATRGDRLFPVDFQRRVAQERLGLVPDDMEGGHSVALSRPVELAERIVAYAAAVPGPAPRPTRGRETAGHRP